MDESRGNGGSMTMKHTVGRLRERLADLVLGGFVLEAREVARGRHDVALWGCTGVTVTLVEHRLHRVRWPWGTRCTQARVRADTPIYFPRGAPLFEAVFDDVDTFKAAAESFAHLAIARRAASRIPAFSDA